MKRTTVLLPLVALLGATSAFAEIVYDNSSNDKNTRFNGTNEYGDEIVLGGTGRILSEFIFQYYGTNFSGNDQAELRFYRNDGPLSPSGLAQPGSLLFDSGL